MNKNLVFEQIMVCSTVIIVVALICATVFFSIHPELLP